MSKNSFYVFALLIFYYVYAEQNITQVNNTENISKNTTENLPIVFFIM